MTCTVHCMFSPSGRFLGSPAIPPFANLHESHCRFSTIRGPRPLAPKKYSTALYVVYMHAVLCLTLTCKVMGSPRCRVVPCRPTYCYWVSQYGRWIENVQNILHSIKKTFLIHRPRYRSLKNADQQRSPKRLLPTCCL